MDIVILGSGNVASVLGRKFVAAGHRIVQIFSRNASAASALAYEWDTESTNYITMITPHADLYLVAVSDSAIAEVVKDLRLPNKIIAHTAASVPMDVLKNVSPHHGVFYPLQSMRKELLSIPEVPLYIDGSDDITKKTLAKLAASISQQNITSASDDMRLKIHVAAVMLNNFVNHFYKLVEDYCRKEGIDFQQFVPLIIETAKRLETISPSAVQTGPAVRNDQGTIDQHIAILDKHPELKRIYASVTQSIRGQDI